MRMQNNDLQSLKIQAVQKMLSCLKLAPCKLMHMIDDSKPLAQRMLQKDFQFFMDYQSAAQEPLPLLQKKNSNVEKIRSQMNAQKELGKVF